LEWREVVSNPTRLSRVARAAARSIMGGRHRPGPVC
jgi:hypothetical protein